MISLTQLLFSQWTFANLGDDPLFLYEITPMKFTADQQLTSNYEYFSTDRRNFQSFGRDKYAGMVESEIQNQEYSLKLIDHPLKFNQPFTLTNQRLGVIRSSYMGYSDGVGTRPIFTGAEKK